MKTVKLTLKTEAMIPVEGLPEKLVKTVQEDLAFINHPHRLASQFKRVPQGPEVYYGATIHNGMLHVPRAWTRKLIEGLDKHRVRFEIDDQTLKGPRLPWQIPTGGEWPAQLLPRHLSALVGLGRRRYGILEGPSGAGKREIGARWIAERGVPTLIVVGTLQQLHAWAELLYDRFNGAATIGLVGDGKKQTDADIIIGTNRSLKKGTESIVRTVLSSRIAALVYDRVDRLPVSDFWKVGGVTRTGWILGLSNGRRADNMDMMMKGYCGETLHRIDTTPAELAMSGARRIRVDPVETGWWYTYNDDFAPMVTKLIADNDRNEILVNRIIQATAMEEDRAVVVTDRAEHPMTLGEMLSERYRAAAAINCEDSAKTRDMALTVFQSGAARVIMGTPKALQWVPEGSFNVLVIASPVRWDRDGASLLRKFKPDTPGLVLDFIDKPGPLKGMWHHRRKVYHAQGFSWANTNQ